MIQEQTIYRTDDGSEFCTLGDAQKYEDRAAQPTLTPEMVRGVLKAATPGEWRATVFGFVETPSSSIAQFWDKFEEDFPNWEANAALIAAAPDLARAYLTQAAELAQARAEGERLTEALEVIAAGVEIAGQMRERSRTLTTIGKAASAALALAAGEVSG